MVERRDREKEKIRMSRRVRFWVAAMGAIVGMGAIASAALAANPPAEIEVFSMTPSTTQAGGHPDVKIDIEWSATPGGTDCEGRCLTVRTIGTHFPTGFIGNPHVAPKCMLSDLYTGECPVDSQIGVAFPIFEGVVAAPLYNMETRPDQAGMTAFMIPLLSAPFFLELSGRTDSDYGLDALGSPILQAEQLTETEFILWGVPADPVHDTFRLHVPLPPLGGCITEICELSGGGADATVPPAPLLQNPIVCDGPLTSSVDVDYYGGEHADAQSSWPEPTGCDQLGFEPSQTTKPTSKEADSPAGVDVDTKVPQPLSATTPTPSQIRDLITTLPEGFSINPNAADGKVACADSETSIGTLFAANCPDFAKVGTLELDVSALPGPIPGALYLGEPKPGDPYRLILTADGFATHVKLTGSVRPDPVTGRLTVAFEDLPQSPVQRVNTHFFGSERGILATPERCGTYEVQNEFVPWNRALSTRNSTSFITIDSGPNGGSCPSGPRPFAPRSEAGSQIATAGMHTPFHFTLDRDDGDQNLTGVNVSPPPGFAATLRGVPYCPEAAIAKLSDPAYEGRAELASPACGTASQIGDAAAGAGAGSRPLYTSGKVYLAGPYRGAPLSLLFVIPAVSGPYDLGNVSVRAAIHVDPVTARVTTVTDPLPQILEGIPLRTRSIFVKLDRPGFTFNPTNCDPFTIETTAFGDEGATLNTRSHFQAADCADLHFEPKLSLKLRGSAKRRGHPALRAVLRRSEGEANLRRAVVAMPKSLLLDQSHIGTVCTRVQFAAEACPPASVYGHATLETPILEEPLRGPVYLRSSSNPLPDIVVDLAGQIDVELVGRVDTARGGGLRTTFNATPDAPFSKFVVDLKGGARGLLVVSTNLCTGPPRATVVLDAQNGTSERRRTKLQTTCRRAAKRSSHWRLYQAGAVG